MVPQIMKEMRRATFPVKQARDQQMEAAATPRLEGQKKEVVLPEFKAAGRQQILEPWRPCQQS